MVGHGAWRIVDAPTRRLTNAELLPPPSPYYFLIVVCHQLLPLAGGLVTPITIDAPLASRRDENNVMHPLIVVYIKKMSVVLFYSPS